MERRDRAHAVQEAQLRAATVETEQPQALRGRCDGRGRWESSVRGGGVSGSGLGYKLELIGAMRSGQWPAEGLGVAAAVERAGAEEEEARWTEHQDGDVRAGGGLTWTA